MGKFMLKLIGMYIPFVLVILGIGACSYIYKDNFLGTPKRDTEEVIEPVPEPMPEPEVSVEEITPIEEEQHDAVEMETDEGKLSEGTLPGIGECVCPDK
tara:strand:+ start:474 stop:770 length:297 start_codon:yes stop_codon:yes gene_type:complete